MKSPTLKLSLMALLMFGFSFFALIPLFDVFVALSGLNGKTGRIEASAIDTTRVDTTRVIEVRFLANTGSGLPWSFEPLVKKMDVHPGKLYDALYRVRSSTEMPTTGQAVPSVSPGQAAKYFNKTRCFCFTQQYLAGYESRDLPLQFIIDSAISENIEQITLSYTFFIVDKT